MTDGATVETVRATPSHGSGDVASPLVVRVARGEDAAAALDARWDSLVAAQQIPNATLSADWLRELLPLASGLPLAVTVERGDDLVAAGLFEVRAVGGRRGPRLARWIADTFSIVSVDLPTTLDVPEAAALLVQALLEEAHAVEVRCLAGSPFAHGFETRTPWRRSHPELDGWVTPLPPPKLASARRRAEYMLRRAERAGVDVAVRVAEEPEPVAMALERLFDLHEERWRGRHEALPRFGATEDQRHFYRRAIGAVARKGRVRLVEVVEDDLPVASYLGLLHGRGALFHTTATRLGGRLRSPGHVGMVALVDAAAAAGAEAMALGQGSGDPEGPKARIGSQAVPYLTVFAGRTAATQRFFEHGQHLRRRVQRLLRHRS